MKIWRSHGSEHSANLVMIGHFKSVDEAKAALETIQKMEQKAGEDQARGRIDPYGGNNTRYSDALLEVAKEFDIWDLTPTDYASFVFEVHAKQVGKRLEFWTDDTEILGYVKLLVNRGAKVEVYSRDDYPTSDNASESGDSGEEPSLETE